MSFITRLLGTKSKDHKDLLADKHLRSVFSGFIKRMRDGRLSYVPFADCYTRGKNIFVRPADVTTFLHRCKQYGIDTHPTVIEMNRRFATDPTYYVEYRHYAKMDA